MRNRRNASPICCRQFINSPKLAPLSKKQHDSTLLHHSISHLHIVNINRIEIHLIIEKQSSLSFLVKVMYIISPSPCFQIITFPSCSSMTEPSTALMTSMQFGLLGEFYRIYLRSYSKKQLSSFLFQVYFLSLQASWIISQSICLFFQMSSSICLSSYTTYLAAYRSMVPPIHFILFLCIFWMQPIPSRTLVISQIRLFCTPSCRVAQLISSMKFYLLLMSLVNLLVRIVSVFQRLPVPSS